MKTIRNELLILGLMLLTLIAVSACGKKKTTASAASTPTTQTSPQTNSNPTTTTTNNDDLIICNLTVTNLNQNALSAYMYQAVENLRGQVTACVKLYGTSKYFDAALRIEYVDDFGVTSYNLVTDYTIFSEIKNNTLRVVWLDKSGFVELKGSRQTNGKYLATIKFSNLPQKSSSYYFSSSANSVYDNCHSGVYSFSQCATWSQPVYISNWTPNNGYYTETQLLQLVDEYLAGQHGSSAYTLGRIEFNLSSVVIQ